VRVLTGGTDAIEMLSAYSSDYGMLA
jgi:hypothetical protein